jgi:hypothetical protein
LSSGSPAAQEYEPALENPAESEMGLGSKIGREIGSRGGSETEVGGEGEGENTEVGGEGEDEDDPPGKFPGCFQFLLTFKSACYSPTGPASSSGPPSSSGPANPPHDRHDCSGRPSCGPESRSSFRPGSKFIEALKYGGVSGSAYGPGECQSVLPLPKGGRSLDVVSPPLPPTQLPPPGTRINGCRIRFTVRF